MLGDTLCSSNDAFSHHCWRKNGLGEILFKLEPKKGSNGNWDSNAPMSVFGNFTLYGPSLKQTQSVLAGGIERTPGQLHGIPGERGAATQLSISTQFPQTNTAAARKNQSHIFSYNAETFEVCASIDRAKPEDWKKRIDENSARSTAVESSPRRKLMTEHSQVPAGIQLHELSPCEGRQHLTAARSSFREGAAADLL